MRRFGRTTRMLALLALLGLCGMGGDAIARGDVSFTVGRPKAEPAAREALRQLNEGEFDALWARFSPEMQAALPAEQLPGLWAKVTTQVGALRTTGAAEIRKTASGEVVDLPCRFDRAEVIVEFVISAEGKISGFHILPPSTRGWTPPAYADTTRLAEVPIEVTSPAARLPGVLSLPRTSGQVPAVLLLAGSGPQDRDETIGPNKALRDLAYGLASRGIAVLRYDKRTLVAGRTMDVKTVTVEEEVLADADSALALLRRRPEIDGARIFVVGHSLGANLAPELARRNAQLRGIALLAGSARPLLDLITDQFRYLASIEPDSARAADLVEKAKLAQAHKNPALPDSVIWMGMPLRYTRDLDRRGSLAIAKSLDLPILIIQGGRDYQVTMADFDLWQGALGQKENATFRLFPELNHLMMAGEGPASPRDYEKPGHVDTRVIDELANFVRGH